jgi:hypothetical protein
MLPLYAARIEDLGRGDLVKVDCATCHHVALLTPEALLRVGPSPAAKVLDLRLRCRGCGRRGRSGGEHKAREWVPRRRAATLTAFPRNRGKGDAGLADHLGTAPARQGPDQSSPSGCDRSSRRSTKCPPRGCRPRAHYRLTPKGCPTRAGRLKAASVATLPCSGPARRYGRCGRA